MTEAKLYDRSFSEGYATGFAGRARECPYLTSEGKFEEDQWHAGYSYGQHVAIAQNRRLHHKRLTEQMLKAGCIAAGKRLETEQRTPQGSRRSYGILTICTQILIPVAKIVGMA